MANAAAGRGIHQPDNFVVGIIVVSRAYLDGLRRIPVFGVKSQETGRHGDVAVDAEVQVLAGNGNPYRGGGLAHQLYGVAAGTALGNPVSRGYYELQSSAAEYRPRATVPPRYVKACQYAIIAAAAGRVEQLECTVKPMVFAEGACLDGLRGSPVIGRKSQAVGSRGDIAESSLNDHGYDAGGLRRQSDGVVDGIALGDGQLGGANYDSGRHWRRGGRRSRRQRRLRRRCRGRRRLGWHGRWSRRQRRLRCRIRCWHWRRRIIIVVNYPYPETGGYMVNPAPVGGVHQPDNFVIPIIIVSGAHLDGLPRIPVFGRKYQAVGRHGDVGVDAEIQVFAGNGNRYRAGGLPQRLDGVGRRTALGNPVSGG